VSRYRAVHVGRSGEVAGGMTQVVNGYLTWQFEAFDTRVILSRDGSTGVAALRVALAATGALLRLRGTRNTVVVVHLSQGGSFVREGLLLLLARARGFATVAQLHGSAFAAFAGERPRLVARVLRAAHLVLTLSDETRAVAVRFVGTGATVLLPNAVESGTPAPAERLVVFGGAVTARKGVDVLVEAWRQLQENPAAAGWRLIVAGPLLEPDIVPAALTNAEFVGAVPHSALMALLDRSSVAVLPSRDEAMPMFVLEAMARQNCVLSTTVGGLPAVLGDATGMLVPPGDVDALRAALTTAIADDGARQVYADRARAAFDTTYSAAAVYPRVERAWRTALERRMRR
jgi:glycosyltransferase involved in cell wall biosynthesis